MSAPLELSDVTFAYRSEPVLAGLSLTVSEGESVAVLGPNGTGKTTLVRIASGALRPREGSVRLYGDPIGSLDSRERARRVAVVPQETRPAFDFRVREMVLLGRAPHQGILGRASREDLDAAQDALERCDLVGLADRDFDTLSGGERQRVALARALAQQTRLLLLDEPTAFLDLRHRLDVYSILEALRRDRNVTSVVVSHDINLAARHCDRLVLLHGGGIAADGAPAEVLTPDLVRAVYGVDAEIRTDGRSGRPFVVPIGRLPGR